MGVLKLGSQGADIMKIQALLDKLGYNPGPVNGKFDQQTCLAVMQFQKNNGLTPDGIIDLNTMNVLSKFILGYQTYKINPGDNIQSLAKKYSTAISKIITANPDLNPYYLKKGQEIIIPYGNDVVDTNVDYTYEIMEMDIKGLKARYPFIQYGSAGNSVLNRKLYYLKLGEGPNRIFYNSTHHGLEWITSLLLMKFIENFAKAYSRKKSIREYDIEDIWKRSTLFFIPMVNPDGVDLVLNGLHRDNPYYEHLIKWNRERRNFGEVWQANVRGVDLNHNYDASWNLSKQSEYRYGIYGPRATRYSGPYPESEPETKAMVEFTRENDFRLVLAFHSQGEVIYWNYNKAAPETALEIAAMFSKVSGYQLDEAAGIASYAGFKDWFIQEFRRPGYTIEVGSGKNPLPLCQFNKIYNDNEELLLLATIV